MRLTYIIKTAVIGLKTHKSRAFLTILGIVIGITSIMVIMSLGNGAQNLILDQVQGMGTRTIEVSAGREPKGPSDAAQIFSDSLKEKDYVALKNKTNVPTAEVVMPMLFGGETAIYGNETYRASIFSGTEAMFSMFDIKIGTGDTFTSDDVRSKAAVAVIGYKIRDKLFGTGPVIGEKIRIKNINFRVVGVIAQKGTASLMNFDEAIITPYTTAQQYIFGIKYFNRFFVQADSENSVARTLQDIKTTLRESHNITDPEKDDFFAASSADVVERLKTITSALTIFLAAVAAISLLVGGVGIMNIMLVSVTERTREIGLRKAVGATNDDILKQFLVEAGVLTFFGGLIGVILGITISILASWGIVTFTTLAWRFTFPFQAMFLGLFVSVGVGLLFGLYPARQASKKSPMEALRYE